MMPRPSVLLVSLLMLVAAPAGAVEPPPALRDWQDWVLRDLPQQRCPLLRPQRLPQPGAWACVWPGRVDIDVAEDRIGFVLEARLYAEDWLPLPGDESLWPSAVGVEGREQPVLLRDGRPALRLPAGRHRIEGRIEAARRPAQLPLPEIYAWVNLRVDGQQREAQRRSAQGLWLGVPDAPAPTQPADALGIEVFRRLDDGVPMLLQTRIRLVVSGAVRELDLGPVLPAGLQPLSLESALEAAWLPDRGLRVLLRPGSHQLVLQARASSPLPQLAPPALPAPWPDSELWSFAADPQLRVLEPSAARPVDPRQEGIPADWQHLPAWRLQAGEVLALAERSRGRSEAGTLSLRLNRELWLDFDGAGLHSRDRIHGQAGGRTRLEQVPGWTLLRAELDGQPQPLSRSADGRLGVELRAESVDLLASSRLPAGRTLSVTGWQLPFDGVELELHLPPGRVLLAASGADRASDTWLAGWTLLDVFLVLLTAMLAGRLFGLGLGLVTLALLSIAYPEAPGLLYALLLALALQLLGEAVGSAGWFARLIRWLRNAALLVLALVALPFVAGQLRLALYPQLERPQVSLAAAGQAMRGLWAESREFAGAALKADGEGFEAPGRPPPQTMTAPALPAITGQPQPAPPSPQRSAPSPLALAGPGQPDWVWTLHRLSWSGPVLPEQGLRLWILPRWATALLRVASVLLLAWLLLVWAQRTLRRIAPASAGTPAAMLLALGLAAGLIAPPDARAQTVPDPTHLQALRDWLLRPPPCAPVCTDLARLELAADAQRLRLLLDVHVESAAGFAVPAVEPRLRITTLRVDGQPADALLQEGAQPVLWLTPGIRRVELELSALDSEQVQLSFPQRPRRLGIATEPFWSAAGIAADGRLSGSTLELRRRRSAEAETEAAAQPPGLGHRGLDAAPFFRVERELVLGSEWQLHSRVQQIAPLGQPARLELPLWPGERPLELPPGIGVDGEQLLLDFAAGRERLQWSSRLELAPRLALQAGDGDLVAEQWRISASGLWRVNASGLPLTALLDPGGVRLYRPLSGEQLVLEIEAVEALPGDWLAVDAVDVDIQLGRRASDYRLEARLRAAQAGQHRLWLPEGVELLGVEIDGQRLNLALADDGSLQVPVAPGTQELRVSWRDPSGVAPRWSSRMPAMGAAAANIGIELRPSDERWVLATRGPALGPAVLYWSELAVMLLLAVGLARTGRTPLKLHHWLLLGLGFSTLSWAALVFIVVWLLAVDLRSRARLSGGQLNLVQIGLGLMTLAALGVLVSIIPLGLLGGPDMHLTGNGSSAGQLRWFADRSPDGVLPEVGLWSLPIWAYRLAILAWAMWLAAALLGWLRWTWQAMGHGGYWDRRPAMGQAGAWDRRPAADEASGDVPKSS